MDGLMDFLQLPGVLPAILAIFAAIGWWIRYDAKRRLEKVRGEMNVAITEAKSKAEATAREAERKADEAKAELAEGQTIAQTLHLLVKLQEQSLTLQDTNQRHNREERERSQREYVKALESVQDSFSARYGQLAGTIAANTEAMTAFTERVEAMTAENAAGRAEAVKAVEAVMNKGVASIQTDFAELIQEWKALKDQLASWRVCEDTLKPTLLSIENRLTIIQARVDTVPVVEAKPDDEPPLELPKAG